MIVERMPKLHSGVTESNAFDILGIGGAEIPMELIDGFADGPGGTSSYSLWSLGHDQSHVLEIDSSTPHSIPPEVFELSEVTKIHTLTVYKSSDTTDNNGNPTVGDPFGAHYWKSGEMRPHEG